jgi:predicted enzyme related to lactoylglutathione lyase
MVSTEAKIQEVINSLNKHEISKFLDSGPEILRWIALDGSIYSGSAEIQELWNTRFRIFPDFQIQLEKFGGSAPNHYAHVQFMGSAGANKSIALSFSTPVLLEVDATHERSLSFREYGDPSKLSDIEGALRAVSAGPGSKVSGFGGVFYKTQDPKATAAWYDAHLGTTFGDNSWNTFKWRERENRSKIGRTEFSLFKADSDYFAPSEAPFMFNFRVDNLEELLRELSEKEVTIVGKTAVFEYGKFAWILDPDGNKIELWEPIDAVLEAYDAG